MKILEHPDDMNDREHSRIRLRPLREGDITDTYLSWFKDPEVTRFLDARNITREDAIDHLRSGQETNNWYLYAICLEGNDQHIGNLKIGPIHNRHKLSDMVTVIGDRSVWGRGLAREAIRQGINIAFGDLNLRKLSASIDSLNTASIKAYTAAGFEIETKLQDQFLHEDSDGVTLSDKVYVACFNPNFLSGDRT